MAGNNYKLLIQAQLDPSKIQAEIKALSGKSVLLVRTEFKQDDFAKFEKKLEEVTKSGKSR